MDYSELVQGIVEKKQGGMRAYILNEKVFAELLGSFVSQLDFNEDYYLARYPDVRKAIESGLFADGYSHFKRHGFLEGRAGAKREFDEVAYLERYPAVAQAVKDGAYASGEDHFEKSGRREGYQASL